jgi:rubrerythrin
VYEALSYYYRSIAANEAENAKAIVALCKDIQVKALLTLY